MAKKKGINVNSVILIIVVVLVVGLSLGVFFKAPVGETGEGELAQSAGGGGMLPGASESDKTRYDMVCCKKKLKIFPLVTTTKFVDRGVCHEENGDLIVGDESCTGFKDTCPFTSYFYCSECHEEGPPGPMPTGGDWEYCHRMCGCPEKDTVWR